MKRVLRITIVLITYMMILTGLDYMFFSKFNIERIYRIIICLILAFAIGAIYDVIIKVINKKGK